MTKDYTAHLIGKHEEDWQSLAELEQSYKAARGPEKKEVEKKINNLCDALAKEVSHCGFHYLETTELADKTWLRKAWERQTLWLAASRVPSCGFRQSANNTSDRITLGA
jgi:hypothetical protein